MNKIIFIFAFLFMCFSTDIHAARFGNGKSFGQKSSSHSSSRSEKSPQHPPQQQNTQQSHNNQTPAPQKSSLASKILPALAGLSAGALIGSLLAGHGLGGGLGSILMMLLAAGIAFYVIKKIISSKTNLKHLNTFQNAATQTFPAQTAPVNNYQEPFYSYNKEPVQTYNQEQIQSYGKDPSHSYTASHHSSSFNREEFLRTAKITFIRMQNSYDSKNLADIAKFTTPEVFAEIQMQIQERGNAANHTEVVHINASLFDEYLADNILFASVFFSGQIKEQENAPPAEINEIWHFTKNENNSWLISGIEQKKFDDSSKF